MTGSERPSPEPLLKKEATPAVLGGERILEMLWRPQMPWTVGFGASQPYSRGEFQEKLWELFQGLSGTFPNFLQKVPAVLGVWPTFGKPFWQLGMNHVMSRLEPMAQKALPLGPKVLLYITLFFVRINFSPGYVILLHCRLGSDLSSQLCNVLCCCKAYHADIRLHCITVFSFICQLCDLFLRYKIGFKLSML